MSNALNNLTVSSLKRWAKSNRKLAKTVLMAQAFAECERERVDAYIRPIFVSYRFRADLGNGEILTDPDRAFLSEDDDRMVTYYAECDAAHRANGFDGPDGHCPALVAEEMQRQAEQVLLDSLGELVGVDGGSFNRSLETRARALELALGACMGNLQ